MVRSGSSQTTSVDLLENELRTMTIPYFFTHGNSPHTRVMYSLCTAPSVAKRSAISFEVLDFVEHIMTPEVSLSSRLEVWTRGSCCSSLRMWRRVLWLYLPVGWTWW